MNKHTYAHQLLRKFDIQIYSSPTTQILQFPSDGAEYPLSEIHTSYILNRQISTDTKKIIHIDRYEDIIRFGYMISKRRAVEKLFSGQKVEYFIIKRNSSIYDMGVIPPNHIVEFNVEENWIRLVGNNSHGRKIFMSQKRGRYHKEFTLENAHDFYSDYMSEISPFTIQEQEKRINIPEIPILISDDGKLVCYPMQKDMPLIGVFGRKGVGKTLSLHMFADILKNKLHKRVIIDNDGVSFQTKSWSLPWNLEDKKTPDFVDRLKLIGHETSPLPCVYLFQNTEDLNHVDLEDESAFRTSLPFKDIMLKSKEEFFEGVEDLGKSGKWFDTLMKNDNGEVRPDGLLYIKNIEEINNLVDEQVLEEHERGSGEQQLLERVQVYKIQNEGVRGKLKSLLRESYNTQMFDVSTAIPSKWLVRMPSGDTEAMDPWRALLYCDLVPVLVTSHIRGKKYFAPYFRFIQDDLFKMQSEDPFVKKNQLELWHIIDEIQSLFSNPILRTTLTKAIKESRPNRTGYVYATQYFGDIPDDIQLLTDYVITFAQNKAEGAKILENFEAMKHQIKAVNKLKKYEAIVAGKSGNPLVVYDTEGRREVVDDGTPFKGTVFPPVSQHSAPKSEGI